MIITFEIPREIEQQIRTDGKDLDREAREAYLVELYRQDRITHHQLAEALNLTRFETDGLLKRHKISSWPTVDDLRPEIGSLRNAKPA